MTDRVQIAAIAASVGLLILVLELVRRRRLTEEYSVLWILSAIALIGVSWRHDRARHDGSMARRLLSARRSPAAGNPHRLYRFAMVLGDSVATSASNRPPHRGDRCAVRGASRDPVGATGRS